VPFEKLVDELQPTRTLSHNPLFQVWFVLQNAQTTQQSKFADLTTEAVTVESADTRHDLQLTLWETVEGLKGSLNYSTDLFDVESIAQIEKQFQALLALITANPESRLSTLRTLLATVARDYREELSGQLEESSHRKLKSVKRKAIGRPQPTTVEEPWTSPTQ
jgi:non-ribosomal peptide synthetase component F